MSPRTHLGILFLFPALLPAGTDEEVYQKEILPVLDRVCYECHEPGLSKGDIPFLEAETAAGIRSMRSVWRSVSSQLRNRTMPPPEKEQPTDAEREKVAAWILGYLEKTAPLEGPYAGNVTARRLNRLEYNNTVRDLTGIDLHFDQTLPADGGTGEGFNNSGESLFLQPMLLERYLEAAQQITDAAIVSPRRFQTVKAADMLSAGGESHSKAALVTCYVDDDYDVTIRTSRPDGGPVRFALRVDGVFTQRFEFTKTEGDTAVPFIERKIQLRIGRGTHALTVKNLTPDSGSDLLEVRIRQTGHPVTDSQERTHRNLLAVDPGKTPRNPRLHASDRIRQFLIRAYRRPVEIAEVEKFLALYDRSAARNDPWEESMKLALRGILVSPDFLYRLESQPAGREIRAITDHELATRLSYFLWNTMPDEELIRLADENRLHEDAVLTAQVNRLLDSPRSLSFARDFVGQWLGTKDVGGKVAPVTNEIQGFYTNEVAADMREEVVLIFHDILKSARPLTDLVRSDSTFLTGRLAAFYGLKEIGEKLVEDKFQRVTLTEQQRGGLLGAGAVLAMTSHYKQTSPVLRGAWVFDTLIGDPVPPPPPDVPALPKDSKSKKLTDKERLAAHRDHASCMACHNIIDPIGFALQNYDFIGRWRDKENGKEIDTTGKLPGGESFHGPAELKSILVESRGEDLQRNLIRKLLGYGLGRSLNDRDDANIAELAQRLEKSGGNARELIIGIVLSVPFRNRQEL